MGITAICLLQIKGFVPPAGSGARVTELDDASLLYTGASFADEPDALSENVRALVGDALDQHRDSRGVFFIPDVAAPKARSYEAVIEEVGEGGLWAPLPTASSGFPMAGFALPEGGLGGLEAMLGNMLGQMPPSLLQAASDAARGDPAALQSVTTQLSALLGSSGLGSAGHAPGGAGELEALRKQVTGALQQIPAPASSGPSAQGRSAQAPAAQPAIEHMLSNLGLGVNMPGMAELLSGGGGIDLSSPAVQKLMANMQAELERDPAQLAKLAEQLFGEGALAPDDGKDDE